LLEIDMPIANGAGDLVGDYTILRVFQDGPPIGDTHNHCKY